MFRTILLVAAGSCLLLSPAAGQEWTEPLAEDAKLLASEGQFGANFGLSVAVIGNTAVISAHADDDVASNAGAAYFFRWSEEDGEWVEEQKLTASDGAALDLFGFSLSMSGDMILVGAFHKDAGVFPDDIVGTGAAYVFRWNEIDEEWDEWQKLEASDAARGDWFGWSVAIDGNVAVISAHLRSGTNLGGAYIFRWDEDEEEWAEEQFIIGDDMETGDRFGSSVAISGDVVVVSSGINTGGAALFEGSGTVHVFRWNEDDEEWQEEQQLVSDGEDEDDGFGRSVALQGNRIVVGADQDDEQETGAGAAYVFIWDEDDEEFQQEQKLTASDGDEDGLFGAKVAIDGALIVVSADRHSIDGRTDDVGTTYLFRWSEDDDAWVEQQKLVGSDAVERAAWQAEVSVSGEVVFVGAPLDDESAANAGAVYVFDSRLREFLRGDVNGNGSVDALPDALFLLRWQFAGGDEPPCMDAADCNDSGTVSAIPDALFLLRWGFQEGDEPPAPGTDECGVDPREEPDETNCDAHSKACD